MIGFWCSVDEIGMRGNRVREGERGDLSVFFFFGLVMIFYLILG